MHARAASLHLLEIVAALHVAHEEEAFERLNVRAGGDHVHRHGDARVVVVAELRKDRLWVFSGLIGDLLAEIIPLPEFFPNDLDDVVGVAIGLGKNQRLRRFLAPGENLGKFLAESADDGADLVRVDDVAVELLRRVGLILILALPALLAGKPLALLHLLLSADLGALFCHFGFDDVDLVADVHAVGDRLLMAVLAHYILAEKAEGAVVRRRGETDEVGVEIFEHLPPKVVDRAMAFMRAVS